MKRYFTLITLSLITTTTLVNAGKKTGDDLTQDVVEKRLKKVTVQAPQAPLIKWLGTPSAEEKAAKAKMEKLQPLVETLEKLAKAVTAKDSKKVRLKEVSVQLVEVEKDLGNKQVGSKHWNTVNNKKEDFLAEQKKITESIVKFESSIEKFHNEYNRLRAPLLGKYLEKLGADFKPKAPKVTSVASSLPGEDEKSNNSPMPQGLGSPKASPRGFFIDADTIFFNGKATSKKRTERGQALQGVVEGMTIDAASGTLSLTGWSADIANGISSKSVTILYKNKEVGSTDVDQARDLNSHFGGYGITGDYSKVGFGGTFAFPQSQDVDFDPADIKVIVTGQDGDTDLVYIDATKVVVNN